MKKLQVLFALSFFSAAQAGEDDFYIEESDLGSNPVSLYSGVEIDAFSSYSVAGFSGKERWATGLGANYFFATIYGVDLGLGAEASLEEGGSWSSAASAILKMPVPNTPLSPYVYGGFGWIDNKTFNLDDTAYHAGAGLEVKINEKFSVFSDWRYTFIDSSPDSQDVRAGIKVKF